MDFLAATKFIAFAVMELRSAHTLQRRKWNHAWVEGAEGHVPHRPYYVSGRNQ